MDCALTVDYHYQPHNSSDKEKLQIDDWWNRRSNFEMQIGEWLLPASTFGEVLRSISVQKLLFWGGGAFYARPLLHRRPPRLESEVARGIEILIWFNFAILCCLRKIAEA